MSLIKILKPDFVFNDERGTLTQLVHKGYQQINSVFTVKGAVRGNCHYHKKNTETFFIAAGTVKLDAYLNDEHETYIFTQGDMFTVPPEVRHTMEFREDTYLIGMYDGCVEDESGNKDIFID